MTVDDSNTHSIIPVEFVAAYPSARYSFFDALGTPFEATVMRLPLEAASALDTISWDAPDESVYVQILDEVPSPTLDALEPVEACRRIAYSRLVLEWEPPDASRVIVPFVESVSRLAACHDVPFDLALHLAPEPCEYLTPVYNETLLDAALAIVQHS